MTTKKSIVGIISHEWRRVYKTDRSRITKAFAMQMVNEIKKHHDALAIQKPVRRLPALCSAQTSISTLKRIVADENLASPTVLDCLKLSVDDHVLIQQAKSRNRRDAAIDLPVVDCDQLIIDSRNLLKHRNPYLRLLALACLTGRRTAELIYTMSFNPPRLSHSTHEKYWAEITGICKQRATDDNPLVSCEVPLLVSRELVVKTIEQLRKELVCTSARQVNAKFGKPIQRVIKRFAPTIGNIHKFRSFYALTCHEYFNERNCSLARLASDYLAHKTMSDTVLSYLSFRVDCKRTLDFSR